MSGDAELITRARSALAGVVDGPWVLEPEIAFGEETTYHIVDVERFRGYRNSVNVGVDKELGEFIAGSPTLIRELADALDAEIESHIETAEIMRRICDDRDALRKKIAAIEELEVSYPCGWCAGGTVDYDDLRKILDGE